ncbi:MAG: helix-turn-helix transcriptional regulator [Anaerolineaceae bacterium]|nr:helix-turn-helix transcriptional regulator [Anaerolineaceae bacterium]
MPVIRQEVGQQIRNAREDIGMSQQELADKLGTRQAYISDLEKGKTEPNVSTLIKLGHFLKKPVASFVPAHYRDIIGVTVIDRADLSPEEEEMIRSMRAAYPILSRGLIMHLLRSIVDYDLKVDEILNNMGKP